MQTQDIPIGQAAGILGVSIDTLRRWSDSGRVPCHRDKRGNRRFEVEDLRRLSLETKARTGSLSARNSFEGTVTEIRTSGLMAQVEVNCRGTIVTSTITRDAVIDLGLAVGDSVVAKVKASSVMIERPS